MGDRRDGERRSKQTLLIGLIIVLISALFIYSGFRLTRHLSTSIRDYEMNDLKDVAAVTARLVRQRLSSNLELLEQMADDATEQGFSRELIMRDMKTIIHTRDFLRMGYTTTDGRQIAISADNTNGRVVDISNDDHFIEAMAGELSIDGATYDDLREGLQTFNYAAPVVVNGAVAGVITATQSVDVIEGIIGLATSADHAVAFLVEGSDDFLSADDEAIESFSREIEQLEASGKGRINYIDDNGAKFRAVSEPVGIGNLNVVIFSDDSSAIAGALKNENAFLVVFIVVCLIMTVMFIILFTVLSRQHQKSSRDAGELRIREEELRLAMEHSGKLICRYEIGNDKLYLRTEAASRFGLPRIVSDALKTLVQSGVIDADCKDDFGAFIQSIKKGDKSGGVNLSMRIAETGEYCWYHADFTNTFDSDLKPIYAVISFDDITEERKKAAAFAKWQQDLKAMPQDKAVVLEWNLIKDTCENSYGRLDLTLPIRADDKFDQRVIAYAENKVCDDDKQALTVMLRRERLIGAYHDGVTRDSMDYRCLSDDGYRWMNASVQLVPYPDDDDIRMYVTLRDIDDEKRAEISERERANTDVLTGAVNRYAFEERVETLLKKSQPTDQHAVMMLDVNDFKRLGGSGGLGAGDDAIKDLIANIKTVLFHDDIVGRVGEDEFMIFLKDIPYDAIVGQKAAQICELVTEGANSDMPPRLSMGIAMYPQDGRTYYELYQNADTALFRVREIGGGGYAFFSGRLRDAGPALSAESGYAKYILVACETELEREAFAGSLEDSFRTISAKDSDGVLIQLRRYGTAICCMILDLDMPGINVFDIMKYVRKNEAYVSIPIIVISSDDDMQTQLDAISAGAVDFLRRPIDAGLLRVKVLSAIRRVENDFRRVQKSYSLFQSSHEERYRRVLDATGTLVFINDLADDRYVYSADASRYLSGNFDSRPLDRILVEDCAASASKVAQMMDTARDVAQGTFEDDKAQFIIRLKTPSGDMHWFKIQFIRMQSKGELTRKMLITFNDMNDEIEASEAIKFRAERDMLTRLYNVETFYEKVKELITKKPDCEYTLCSVDVDNFKVLNDQYGRAEGDKLLIYIALLLRESVEPVGGICCRVSADNFAYLFPNSAVATRFVWRAIEKKCAQYQGPTSFKLSTGVYVIDDVTLPIDLIYDRASIAKKSIKGNYLHHIAYYTDGMRDKILQEQSIVAQMEYALQSGQFEVYMQPQFELSTSSLVGAEALVRWNHPEKGLILPSQFIPIFEKNGFISRLDRFVWEKTLSYIKAWIDRGEKALPVSINVSRGELLEDDFVAFLTGAIERCGVPKELFNVEITETAFAGMPEIIVNTVNSLKNYGIIVEIDDFGSGYSSLNTLKDVKADMLKLDMRFMDDAGDSRRGGAIVNSIIRMARWLNMPVIAEGVETKQQADFLKSIGCRYVQGYLYAHPMPVEEFEKLKESSSYAEIVSGLPPIADIDADEYWKPDSSETFDFNNSIKAEAIAEFSYSTGALEIIRANEMCLMSFGSYLDTQDELLGSDMLALFDSNSLSKAVAAIQTAIKSECDTDFDAQLTLDKGAARLHIWLSILSRSVDSALIRLTIIDQMD